MVSSVSSKVLEVQHQASEIIQVPRDYYQSKKGFYRAAIEVLCEHGKAVIIDETAAE